MGAASSVLVNASTEKEEPSPFPDEIVALVHRISVFKTKIALIDSKLVIQELGKKFVKDCRMLVLSLTSRTKSQLQAMVKSCGFSSSEELIALGPGGFGKLRQPIFDAPFLKISFYHCTVQVSVKGKE